MFLKLSTSLSRARVLFGRLSPTARQEKKQRSRFYLEMWRQAASELGATVTETKGELLCIAKSGRQAFVYRNYTDLDGPATLRAAGDKPLVARMLQAAGIPTPNYLAFSANRLDAARPFLDQHGECVVKPAFGTGGGAGVTTGVRTHGHLKKAAIVAAGYDRELVIEQQVAGKNLRLLFLDGRLLEAVERRPPTVVGDGTSTVAALLDQANRHRREQGLNAAQVFLRYDFDMQRTLARQGLTHRDVPERGVEVCLKTVINDNAAADNVLVTDTVCPAVVDAGRRAAEALGVRLAGVDIITSDPKVDLATGGGVVLEINTTPGLYIHRRGLHVPVAQSILEACLYDSHRRSGGLSPVSVFASAEESRVHDDRR